VIKVWDSEQWGTSGYRAAGGGVSHGVIPYVIAPKNYRRVATAVSTNLGPARAWRAPNHPQACAMTQTAIDDLAAKMGRDSYDVFMANLEANNVSSQQEARVYIEEMKIAAELMDWKAKYHLHGKGKANGSVVEGLGLALHTWGGVANNSIAKIKIHPDGGVETFCGSQDLGTGTRTVIAMVVAETLGLSPEKIRVNIGSSKYPVSGASGGSTTVGGVSESHRRASLDALAQILEKVAPALKSDPSELEAVGGRIQRKANPDVSISWAEACSQLGIKPLEVTAEHKRGDETTLSSSGVGGVQMAHVVVDKETGVVKMKKYVAVQDQGLVINPKTCESQIYGAAVMGIAYALFESVIADPKTGAFVNAEMGEYRLPRIGDIGEIVVHLYEPDDQRARGVIGNGEPPVISPGAAISNAVANALGVRVPVLPLTPKRVLEAIKGKA
jgi:xanthine dehydrogenase YagR molybdenum-binding subunit